MIMIRTTSIEYKYYCTMYLNNVTLQHAPLPYIIYIPVPFKVSRHTHTAYVHSITHSSSLHICIHIKKLVIFCRHTKVNIFYIPGKGYVTKQYPQLTFLSERGERENLPIPPQKQIVNHKHYYGKLLPSAYERSLFFTCHSYYHDSRKDYLCTNKSQDVCFSHYVLETISHFTTASSIICLF